MLWMIVSCICFSTMLKLCQHRVSFCDPRNKLTNRQTSDGLKCNTLVLPRNPPQSPQRSNNHGNSYLGPQAENLNSQNAWTISYSTYSIQTVHFAWNQSPTWATILSLSLLAKSQYPATMSMGLFQRPQDSRNVANSQWISKETIQRNFSDEQKIFTRST